MKICIDQHPKLKQWLWFAAIWTTSLVTVLLASKILKLIMNQIFYGH